MVTTVATQADPVGGVVMAPAVAVAATLPNPTI
jgi:hypothetical protein